MDLTGDGISDVVVNTPTSEKTDRRVSAIDGASGEVLWESSTSIDMVTVARFEDIDGDGVPDVIVVGRGFPQTRPMAALNGATGEELWRIAEVDPPWRNIYTPQRLDDLTGDGVPEWLIASGGDHVRPAMEKPTVRGRLAVIDGATGAVVATIPVPRDEEIYSSPVLVRSAAGDISILVGSGGEVFAGSLWRLPLEALLGENEEGFDQVSEGEAVSSFIAPVSVGEMQRGRGREAVSVRLDGRVETRNLWASEVRWRQEPAIERLRQLGQGWAVSSLAAPAIGQLDGDEALEIVTLHTFVTNEQLVAGMGYFGDAVVTVIDGATGAIEHELFIRAADSVVSPLIVELDGVRGVICACVEVERESGADESAPDEGPPTRLGFWVPSSGEVVDLDVTAGVSTTPIILEDDGGDDLWLVTGGPDDDGHEARWVFTSKRVGSARKAAKNVWTGYMGPDASGRASERP